MKRNILHTLRMAALLPLLLASCTQEELLLPESDNAIPLSVTVTDDGYVSTDNAVTRVAENGYATNFTAGDACGLYIVRGGKLLCTNIKLTATTVGSSLQWQPPTGTTLAGGLKNEKYFLYYPYQSNMTGKVDAAATDAAGFFAPLVNGWQPKADQSTYANYTASDLMTAEGTATLRADGKLVLSFSMTHRMALAVLGMPKTVYKFTNTPAISDYTVTAQANLTGSVKPYAIASDNTYRYIVKPSTDITVTGSYAGGRREFSQTMNVAAGNYKIYRAGGSTTVQHNLQSGDYLLCDGSLLSKGTTLTALQKAECVAVVFHAGHHTADVSNYSGTGIGQQKCHGYAVALNDAVPDAETCEYYLLGKSSSIDESFIWGMASNPIGCFPEGQDNESYPEKDWSGYAWTQKIIAAGGNDKVYGLPESPITYFATLTYEEKEAAPKNSSGWFLPSIGQLESISDNFCSPSSVLPAVMTFFSAEYWSSSEKYGGQANGALSYGMFVFFGNVSESSKLDDHMDVRPVLAF